MSEKIYKIRLQRNQLQHTGDVLHEGINV